ncbi:MAG: DNA polymerase [Pirellulaceae bacterium]|nr:DNA polymerase [Pirellulaceae bacterium]
MKPIRTTSFDARKCADALQVASLVIVDLETTGLHRHDQIVAAGILHERDAHVLITDAHRNVSSVGRRISFDELRVALSPLSTRSDLQVVMHNATFDAGMLERAGISVKCQIIDTMKLLKLQDSDRGKEWSDSSGSGSQRSRLLRSTGESLNFKLKPLARTVLNIEPLDFPDSVEWLNLEQLVRYLKSDLVITSMLHRHLLRFVGPRCWEYNQQLVCPITPLLVRMTNCGVEADVDFIASESQRILDVMAEISVCHEQLYGQRLDVGDWYLRGWIYTHGLKCRRITSGKHHQYSVRTQDLAQLRLEANSVSVRRSLELISDYKQLQSLMTRLKALYKFVCPHSRRIYSTFNDSQNSGRLSSTRPNLQQIAGELAPGGRKQLFSEKFKEVTIRSRNAVVATTGYTLVAYDIAQSDIRVLAHMVESFRHSGEDHIRRLQADRLLNLRPEIEFYRSRSRNYLQPQNRKTIRCDHCWTKIEAPFADVQAVTCPTCGEQIIIPPTIPEFDPSKPCRLAEDFRNSSGDFYTTATRRMLGRDPKDKSERNAMKQTILGIVNGMSYLALAKRLGVDSTTASNYLDAFAKAYPQVDAYKALTKFEFAITGESWTFAGHHRQITPHRWMVSEPELELFVSYTGADKLWLRVVPLRPNRHTLTCWVLSAIDAKYGSKNEGREIYHHVDGRISQFPYRFFNDSKLIYRLPVRNISWRLIRRVRTRTEEAFYDGYDRTWRQLFNHIAQGGTADIAKIMMIRSQSACDRYSARLLLQIHDELVFEVPDDQLSEFVRTVAKVLSLPPTDNFNVPIDVEPKVGKRFGEMKAVSLDEA